MNSRTFLAIVVVAAGAASAPAAITPATGYAARSIATPTTVQGGVVRRGDLILVGQGPGYTAGAQSIVRITESGGPVTIATGFNSLGGFDLGPDGTLYVVDNCHSADGDACGTTTTGDTVYAIPDALTRTTPVAAATQEIVPAGSIPAAMDVLLAGRTLFVSDAAGNDVGRVVRVGRSGVKDVITGLDFAGGLALTCDGTLLVGDVDADSFAGSVTGYTTSGRLVAPVATGLSGAFAHVVDADGNVLVSGGFTGDFTSSTVLAVPPSGSPVERAHGYGFTTEMAFDPMRDETLVLDAAVVSAISALCRDRDGDGICDADDNCPEVANAGQADANGNGLGDACECVGPVALANAKVKLGKRDTPPGDDTLQVKAQLTVPTSPAIDPMATGLRLRVQDDAGGTVLDASLPGGAYDPTLRTGWKVNGSGTSWTYVSCVGRFGIEKLTFKTTPKTPGQVMLVAKAKRGSYSVGPLPLALSVVIDPAGQCGSEAFLPGDCDTNGSGSSVRCQ